MGEVLCIGEILIDFISFEKRSSKKRIFYQHPGGAPANVAIGLAKLGRPTTFLGKVGNDPFGKFLNHTLLEYNVNTDYLYFSSVNTTLAFVTVDRIGERNFYFYRSPGADTQIEKGEVERVNFEKFNVLHFGSLSLTHNPSCGSIFQAFKKGTHSNNIISFDPNLRLSLWENEEKVRETIGEVLSYVNLLRLNKNELLFLTGIPDINKSSNIMLDKGIELVVVSLGRKGVYFNSLNYGEGYVEGCNVEVKDTTGAGDALTAGILSKVSCYNGLNAIGGNRLEEIIKFGNAVAALSTTKMGAVYSLPSEKEVEKMSNKDQHI